MKPVGWKLVAVATTLVAVVAIALLVVFLPRRYGPTANPEEPRPSPTRILNTNKVVIQFRGFEYWKSWVALFEVINDTGQPILYVGSQRRGSNDYCTLASRREVENSMTIKASSACYYNTGVRLQPLNPGEVYTFAMDEYEIRSMLGLKDPTVATIAQVGFEVFVGEEKKREFVWSDYITFPPEKYPAPN